MSFTLLSPGPIPQVAFGFISASCEQEMCKTGRGTKAEQQLCAGGLATAGMCWAPSAQVLPTPSPKAAALFSGSATCFCHLVAVPKRLKNGPRSQRGDGRGQEGKEGR